MTFCLAIRWRYLPILAVLCSAFVPVTAATKQSLTPEACTEIRYLAQDELTNRPPLELSPDGHETAYVLQVPDVASNDNKDELYVAPVNPQSSETPVPLVANQLITAVSWFPDNRHLAVLIRHGGKMVLAEIDSATKALEIIWEADGDITDYSMDAAGKTIAIAVRVDRHYPAPSQTPRDSRKGYRLDLTSTAHSDLPRRQVDILRRTGEQHWEVSRHIKFISPLSGKLIEDIVDNHAMHISLSPDGHFLLMDNIEKFSDAPANSIWAQNYGVRYEETRGSVGLLVSYLYDLSADKVSMPLNSPYVSEGLWAPDSKSYVKVALAPVGSSWEATDLQKDTPNVHITHLFSVDVSTRKVSEVLNRAERPPIAWTRTGDIIVRDPAGTLITIRRESAQWKRIGTVRIPLADAAPYSPLASDGERVVIEYENASTAPRIMAFDLESGRTWTVAKLNPQVDGLILPKTEKITWTTSTGFTARGLLLLPPDYDPHHRYPLIIENGSILYSDEFVCDSGIKHVPSFARGVLADAGIIYLTRYWPGINDWESNYYPKGLPGYLGEAAFKQDLAESAVRTLDERQIIDPTKVGLVGFSRGGWYVEYMLTHSHIPFQAASATDNVLYSLGEYWYWNDESMARTQEGMYGGPPSGKTLKNWLDNSISFNLDKVRAPLLMEVMGYGKKYEDPDAPPDNLAVHNEVFVGLSRLNKAVEYYYYPDEQHQPDHPQARIASLQRNVDWFRFWLQGYERPNPDDLSQYKRWEKLRTQEVAGSDRKTVNSPDGRRP